ncbi:hypothetical protein [Patulibacter defluvii]|uniref:hypothetical protein n=1 Tax=Patulibacter defluvii TaxID=3095358 RepID=UPI002A75B353|nr:hypothetical protein [Patulibacter sp. DM4]
MRVALPSPPQLIPKIERALDAVIALERTLRTLPDEIRALQVELAILTEVRDDMKGMRSDMRDVIASVEGLRSEIAGLQPDNLRRAVVGMSGGVGRMEEAVSPLADVLAGVEKSIGEMSESLVQIDRIARRFANPLRRRSRIRGAADEGGGDALEGGSADDPEGENGLDAGEATGLAGIDSPRSPS